MIVIAPYHVTGSVKKSIFIRLVYHAVPHYFCMFNAVSYDESQNYY